MHVAFWISTGVQFLQGSVGYSKVQHRTSQISNGNLRLIRLSFTSSLKDTVSKYKCKLKDGDKDLDETIKIDSKKETETFQTASNGGTSPDVPGEVEVIYDFKQVSERGGVGGLGNWNINLRALSKSQNWPAGR